MKDMENTVLTWKNIGYGNQSLVDADGVHYAQFYPYRNGYEWNLYRSADPKDSTRGCSSSESAAKKAVEEAVKKFGFVVQGA